MFIECFKIPSNDFYLNLITFMCSPMYVKHLIFHPTFRTPRVKIFWLSNFSLWFEWSLCKSAKFQLSTSSRSG
jgi:hypothetical protein